MSTIHTSPSTHEQPESSARRRTAAVLVNPAKIDVGDLRAAVADHEHAHGWAPSRWFTTDSADDGRAAAHAAVAADPDVLVVAGGDGTIRVAAEAVAATGTPLGIIAAGTGNLLARNLGLRQDSTADAVRAAFNGADRSIDIGVADLTRPTGQTETRTFLVMAGIGLDAQMAADTDPRLKRRLGWIAYAGPIAKSVIGNRTISFLYRRDEGPFHSMQAHTVIVGNCGTLTAGVLLLPDAQPDDGILDAVAFRPIKRFGWSTVGYALALNRFFTRTRFGQLLHRVIPTPRTLQYTHGRRFELHTPAPEQIQLDGDPFGEITTVTLTVHPGRLRIRS